MKVSVILLTYNQERTISRAISSVLKQKCDYPYEIILADDCSTDSTPDICHRYAGMYPDKIRYISNKVNKGVIDNYFDCVLDARGEYIADCAGDDFWIDDDKLQLQVEILERHPETVLVHTDWKYYDESSKASCHYSPSIIDTPLFRQSFSPPMSLFLPLLRQKRKLGVFLNTALYRKSALLNCYHADPYLFRNKDFSCEDFQIIVELSRTGAIAYIDKITSCYSTGAKSITNPGNYSDIHHSYMALVKLHRYFQTKYNLPDDKLRGYYKHILNYIFAQDFRSKDPQLRSETIDMFRELGIDFSLKSRIKRSLSSCHRLWELSLKLLS